MNNMKRQNDRILKDELPRSVGAQYATGDQWRNNSRKRWSQSKNNTQLWMWIEARSNAVKSNIASVQFRCSVVSDSLQPMNRSMPGLPVHHQLPELTGHLLTWGVPLSVSYHFAFPYCSCGSQQRILKWFAIPVSSGPHSVRPFHHDPPVLGCPAGMA